MEPSRSVASGTVSKSDDNVAGRRCYCLGWTVEAFPAPSDRALIRNPLIGQPKAPSRFRQHAPDGL